MDLNGVSLYTEESVELILQLETFQPLQFLIEASKKLGCCTSTVKKASTAMSVKRLLLCENVSNGALHKYL